MEAPWPEVFDGAFGVTVEDGAQGGGDAVDGLTSASLQVATREASMARFSAPISFPAKSAFFLVSAMGLIRVSTGWVSSPGLPLSRQRLRPGQIARAQRISSASRDLPGLAGDRREPGLEPGPEGCDDRGDMLAAGGETNCGSLAAHAVFDPIQGRDPAQHFLGNRRAVALEAPDEAAANMGPARDRLPWPAAARDLGHRVAGRVCVALQEHPLMALEELQRMLLAAAGGVMERHDARVGAAMAAIVGDHRPGTGRSLWPRAPRVQHRRAGFVDEDAGGPAQMCLPVPDDRHQMETGAPRPVAEGATIEIEALALEDVGLAVEWQMVTEFRDHDP